VQRARHGAGSGEDGLEHWDKFIDTDRRFWLFERGDDAFERADSVRGAWRRSAVRTRLSALRMAIFSSAVNVAKRARSIMRSNAMVKRAARHGCRKPARRFLFIPHIVSGGCADGRG
jgi:hypothetical protein